MKLTRSALEQMITEILRKEKSVLLEMPTDDLTSTIETPRQEGKMLKQQLFHIGGKANQLSEMIQDDEVLPPDVLRKILKASELIGSVFDEWLYEKTKGNINK